jgi:hypothetical protein
VAERGVAVTGTVYQLRVVLAGISPLVWRRLLVPAETSIADLHEILQIAFGWSDEHLHRFTIHAVEYGLWRPGSAGFSRDSRQVRLDSFGLRRGERFTYEYNLLRRVAARHPGGGDRAPLGAPPLPLGHGRGPAGAAGALRQRGGIPGAEAALATGANRRPDGGDHLRPDGRRRRRDRQ